MKMESMKSRSLILSLVCAAMLGSGGFARAQGYSVIDLGVATGSSSRATGVNNSGEVVGNIFNDYYGNNTYTNTAFRYSLSGGQMEALRYDTPYTGTVQQYGTTLHHGTTANAINNAGQIAGSVDTGWTANGAAGFGIGPYAAIIAPGTNSRTIYPGPDQFGNGFGSSNALAINTAGQVAGYSTRDAAHFGDGASILNSNGSWTRLNNYEEYIYGMNDTGQFVGRGGNTGAFMYSGGVVTEINNTLGGTNGGGNPSTARDINNNGIVVGQAYPAFGYAHAYRREVDGTMVDLGSLFTDGLGGRASEALTINDNGLIVGTAYYQGTNAGGDFVYGDYAFLYSEADGMINLTTLLSGSSFSKLTAATAISENGYIAGWGISSLDGQEHAFLLAPSITAAVPEPSTMWLMLLGLAGLVSVRRFAR